MLSDSTALACCTSAPCRGDPDCAQCISDRDRDEQPVGHEADDDGGLLDALRQRQRFDQPVRGDEEFEIDDHQQEDADGQVDLLLQRRKTRRYAAGARQIWPATLSCAHPFDLK